MDLAHKLRVAGLTVITGREGIGQHTAATIVSRITGTGEAHDGASDVNAVAVPNRAVAYVQRNGVVWLLADGPVRGESDAIIYLAAHQGKGVKDAQRDSLAVLEAVLSDAYGLADDPDPSDAGDGDSAPDPGQNGEPHDDH